MTDEQKRRRMEQALAQAGHTHSIADVVAAHAAGKVQWWTNGNGCIVSEIEQYPRLRAVRYWLVFGELRACLALQPEIDSWAIENGCSIATACGRPGWLRAAYPSGWRLHGYAYTKDLTP